VKKILAKRNDKREIEKHKLLKRERERESWKKQD